MAKYIIKRLLITIPVIVLVAILVFSLLYFTPGDPAIEILGDQATTEQLDAMREYLGVNDSYFVQLGRYLKNLFIDFNLGESWIYKTNVSDELAARMPRTTAICIYSVLVGAIFGIPLGVIAAVHQNGIADKVVLASSSILSCVPNYCVGLLLILVFALHLKWFPPSGIDYGWKSYILPCVTIMIGSFSGLSRQMRSSMLEVIRSDYVTSARAQGFSNNAVYYLHALPNALIPIITMMGTQFAAGLGGTMILENIFAIPGVGMYVQAGISKRDRPAVIGCAVFMGVLFCLVMLAVDIVYAMVDPRIRAQYEAQGKGKRRRKKA